MTDHQKKNWNAFCSEPLELVENYKQAEADNFAGWCIHHRLEIKPDGTRMSRQELKDKNLYYGRPASELIFMRFGEHTTLHWLGKHHSEETRKKLSEARKGKHLSTEHRKKLSEAHKGKHLSAEYRKKLSEALKGKHHSAEARKKIAEAHKGKLWWNDGISNKRSKECPGPEWKRGQLKKTRQA